MSECICPESGYSPHCPQAFVQNGTVLHVADKKCQIQPKMTLNRVQSEPIREVNTSEFQQEPMRLTMIEREYKTEPRKFEHYISDDSDDDSMTNIKSDYEKAVAAVESSRIMKQETMGMTNDARFDNDISLLKNRREILKKFEPLRIRDTSLTEMSIGGYEIDLAKASEKAKTIAPLPPSRLPKIFRDGEMNFLHHFFQGFEILIGRDVLVSLVQSNIYSNQGDLTLYKLIVKMIRTGYERTDDEITLFSKKTIISTFELDSTTDNENDEKRLIVAANLWGFQYIESGMQCREADLKMWLSINYNHFRNIWYNTFKSSGIPAFALEGVQSRYETPKKDQGIPQHIKDKVSEIKDLERKVYPERSNERHSSSNYRRKDGKKSNKHEKTMESIFRFRE